MSIDGYQEFNENNTPDYWKLIKSHKVGDIKNGVKEIFNRDPKGTQYQEWIKNKARDIMTSYLHGLTTNEPMSTRICLDDFAMYIYVIEKSTIKKQDQHLKPEPMKPEKSELDKLYDQDRIQNEIDNMLGDI